MWILAELFVNFSSCESREVRLYKCNLYIICLTGTTCFIFLDIGKEPFFHIFGFLRCKATVTNQAETKPVPEPIT
jgi:hypothetical protein